MRQRTGGSSASDSIEVTTRTAPQETAGPAPARPHAGSLRAGSLREVLPEYAGQTMDIVVIYPAGKHPLPRTQAFVRFLARELPPRVRALTASPAGS